jgi:hypothetical protein
MFVARISGFESRQNSAALEVKSILDHEVIVVE